MVVLIWRLHASTSGRLSLYDAPDQCTAHEGVGIPSTHEHLFHRNPICPQQPPPNPPPTKHTQAEPPPHLQPKTSPNAANRLRTTMAAVKLAFTWLGVRKTLAPEQRTTAARAFHADREFLSASKLILDTRNPARSCGRCCPFRSIGILADGDAAIPGGWHSTPSTKLAFLFANTMAGYRESSKRLPVNFLPSTTRSSKRPSDDLARSSMRATTPRRSMGCSIWKSRIHH